MEPGLIVTNSYLNVTRCNGNTKCLKFKPWIPYLNTEYEFPNYIHENPDIDDDDDDDADDGLGMW